MTDIPPYFTTEQSPAVTNYSFTDIAANTGYVIYYGCVYTSGDASYPPADSNGYILTPNILTSSYIIVSGAAIPAFGEGWISQNTYGVTFNKAQNIKGTAWLSITLGSWKAGAGSANNIWISGAYLSHYDGTTSTTISDTLTSQNLVASTTGSNSMTTLLQFDCSSAINHFKKGDTLRLYLPVWGTGGSGTVNYGGYGSDPSARTDIGTPTIISGGYTTQMKLIVPFVIDTT